MQSDFITSDMRCIADAFARNGFKLWIVGGAVRDTLLGQVPKDFDFATDASPEEQIYLYGREGFQYIPTGLKHGTVTVLLNGETYEITTLRTEANHDGRYADMVFTRSIEDDLARRDLTINAMAMEFTGGLIDPFNGEADLAARKVRFVGNPDDRMREDYLRILRWLRFHARISPDQPLDPETIEAAKRQASGLRQISRERVWSEISTMLSYKGGVTGLAAIEAMAIGSHIDLPTCDCDQAAFSSQYTRDPVTLLTAGLRNRRGAIEALAKSWKWSTNDAKRALLMRKTMVKVMTEREIKFAAAVDGDDLSIMIEALRAGGRGSCANRLSEWAVPTFPVSGADLLAAGARQGAFVGDSLREMRTRWGHSDFTLSRDELMRGFNPQPYPADFY